MDLPQEVEWNIVKFMSHPVANLINQRLKDHKISIDRGKPFHIFHFQNTEYDYDYLEAEWKRENEYYLMEEDMAAEDAEENERWNRALAESDLNY